jgi:hypothetical protein
MIHIHNGDLVLTAARRAGIPGEHVAFRESLVSGPVRPGEEWIESRARLLAAANGQDLLRVRTSLVEQEQMLDDVAKRGEIVLWFEYDLFCLVHLLYLLQRLKGRSISMVWCSSPIAEKDDSAMRLLFESREAVPPATKRLAKQAWNAYTAENPAKLNEIAGESSRDLPFLREGFRLHTSRFPSTWNGLGIVEQRALELIAGGTTSFVPIFDSINAAVPRLGFGDSEIFRHLQRLGSRTVPLITIAGEPPKAVFAVTPMGERVLSGEIDDAAINDPDLWFGGVHLTKQTLWRWNGEQLVKETA